jgi:iron-sulfur cluster insertion protein
MADGSAGEDTAGDQAASLLISASAARRVAAIAAAEPVGTFLRISVSGGGCSGFQYNFALEQTRNDDDRSFVRDGAEIVVDEISLGLLGGAELDFVEDLSGAFFQMRNPNATSSCGCGMSFSV